MHFLTVSKSKNADGSLKKNNDVLNESNESHSSEVCKSNFFFVPI